MHVQNYWPCPFGNLRAHTMMRSGLLEVGSWQNWSKWIAVHLDRGGTMSLRSKAMAKYLCILQRLRLTHRRFMPCRSKVTSLHNNWFACLNFHCFYLHMRTEHTKYAKFPPYENFPLYSSCLTLIIEVWTVYIHVIIQFLPLAQKNLFI